MKITEEFLFKSSDRILHSLLLDEDKLTIEDDILLELPLVDFLIRKYNKASYINEKRHRFIKCVLCDKEFKLKDKTRHNETKLHKHKIKLSEQTKENLTDKDIYNEINKENIN